MTTLAAIDPGRAGMGWAIFKDRALVETGILENTSPREVVKVLGLVLARWAPADAVVEVPQVYRQRMQKGDPNDLITVAIMAGLAVAVLAPFTEAQLVRPHAWKGNRPKAVDNQQTLRLLNDMELRMVAASGASKSKLHNVLDAVGLGLWKLGRR
jgi:hypothetical protein